jgi:uncharacterized protein
VTAGIEAWQRSDYSGAVAIWMPLAEKGDPDAEFNLGQAYRLGRGVPANLSAAKTWFKRAANQGHVDAETTLGLLLFQNNDRAAGLKWLRQAADQGEPRAQLVYGTALFNGDGVTQDPVLGYSYVSRAAAQGLAPAKDTLAQVDQLLPAEDRRKGLQIAQGPDNSTASAAPSEKPRKRKQAAKAKPEPQPVATAEASSPPQSSPPARPAKATAEPRPSGAWRIQLGAFSQRGNAEVLYKRLSGNSALSGRQPFYIAAGAVTRLQAGPFESKAAAAAACSRLGVACFPVPAK